MMATGQNGAQTQKKRDQPQKANPLVFLVGQGGVEPPTLGFSVDH